MGTYVSGSQFVPGNNQTYTDALLRAYIAEIRAGLSGAGLVQTSDTGQVNPATATAAANNTDAGYEIWRFNDAAQATDPVFIRIRYRRFNNPCAFALVVQVGQGSNGSGTLTGFTSAAVDVWGDAGTNPTSGNGQTYAYFGDGVFWLCDCVACTAPVYPQPKVCFVVGRTRDDNGALDARGVTMGVYTSMSGGAGTQSLQYVRWQAGNQWLSPFSAKFCFGMGQPTTGYAPGTTDLIAWPHLYYDWGVGVRTAYHAFSAQRTPAGFPGSPTAFDANPFGHGTRKWISWSTAPRAETYGLATLGNSSYLALVLPWEV